MKRPRCSLDRSFGFIDAGGAPRSHWPSACGGSSLFRFGCVAAVVLTLCLSAFCAKKAAEPGVTPVQAELMADVNARLLRVGSPLYARVTADWTGTGCVLRKGAVLEAHVVSVSPYNRSTKLSELGVAFTRAQCAAPKMAALDLLLAAMAAPPRMSDLGILSHPLPMNTYGVNGLATLGAMQLSANVDMKLSLDSSSYDFPDLPRMHMGDVSGIHGLKLSVGSGTGNSTVLASRGRDVALEKHTLLLLIPAEGVYPRPGSGSTAESEKMEAAPVAVTAVAPEAVAAPPAVPSTDAAADVAADAAANDIDLCDPSRCSVALPSGDEKDGGKLEAGFSVRQIGYAPRLQPMDEVDRDEALGWLSPRQLLVAFNPHGLITRHPLGPSGSTQRIIRAALLDTGTGRITRTVDWELPDSGEYLWRLADSRVLVHVGSELRVYGEGLKITQRMGLDGPLAFVRVTPDGNFIVVGQIHERHSPELHAALSETLQHEPEEDVGVTVLNRNFETIAKSDARTDLMPPTLLNEGQTRLQGGANRRYRVTLLTWDGRSSVLASLSSGCLPKLSSLAPDLLFLASCNPHNGLLEYRVLNSSGKLTLRGNSNPNDMGQSANGIADPGRFVVRTIRSSAVSSGDALNSPDFEELGVYRAADGKRLLGVRVGSPSSSLDSYALAADGSQLAVLARDQVSIYSVVRK